jgi:DNA-binding GntR family transcriptional regulator
MNFKEATDGLFDRIDHAELAEALGVSVASIRQARLSKNAKAYREPPPGWENAVAQLATAQIRHYRELVELLKEGKSGKFPIKQG